MQAYNLMLAGIVSNAPTDKNLKYASPSIYGMISRPNNDSLLQSGTGASPSINKEDPESALATIKDIAEKNNIQRK